MHRQFCPTCGTPVFTQSEARLHMIGVRAGTLDDVSIGERHESAMQYHAHRQAALVISLVVVTREVYANVPSVKTSGHWWLRE